MEEKREWILIHHIDCKASPFDCLWWLSYFAGHSRKMYTFSLFLLFNVSQLDSVYMWRFS